MSINNYFDNDLKSKNSKYYILIILLLTILVYSNSLFNGFTNWDDTTYIHNNHFIKIITAHSIKLMFSTVYFGNYHPLTTLSYAIEYKLFGLNPFPYHFDNLLLHLINVVLVFYFIKSLSGRDEIAFITSLFFAIHPMHVESVAWISERKDVLYSMFYLASLIAYLKYIYDLKAGKEIHKSTLSVFYYPLSVIFFICSLLSKPAAVTLPLILFLIDYFYDRIKVYDLKSMFKSIVEKIPFLILSVILGIIIFRNQSQMLNDNPAHFGILHRIFIIYYSIAFYFIKLFAPFNLSALHVSEIHLSLILVLKYFIAPVAALFVFWLISVKLKILRKEFMFGILFFLINLSLILHIIPFGNPLVSERYSYIPYVGLFYTIACYFYYILNKYHNIFLKVTLYSIFIIAVVGFSFLTYSRNKVWKNSETLWEDVISKTPSNEAYIGLVAIKQPLSYYKQPKYYYETLLRLNSRSAYSYMGWYELENHDYVNAIHEFDKALINNPNDAVSLNNRGYAKLKLHDLIGSLNDINRFIRLNPDNCYAYMNFGLYYVEMNNMNEACDNFKKALKLGYAEKYDKDVDSLINKYCNK